jgi:hypothetical protein
VSLGVPVFALISFFITDTVRSKSYFLNTCSVCGDICFLTSAVQITASRIDMGFTSPLAEDMASFLAGSDCMWS